MNIPYPPVFHDWRSNTHERVVVSQSPSGVIIEMMLRSPHAQDGAVWKQVELTEDDACLLAASLLRRAGRKKLSRRVLKTVAL